MAHEAQGSIIKVSGPLVVARGLKGALMYEVVRVSDQNLIGEIIALKDDEASIQVYEDTSGIGPGEKVERTGAPLSVVLGPGLLESIYDGIQRPLSALAEKAGSFITRGIDVPAIDETKTWEFTPTVKVGDTVEPGDVLGEVPETSLITHRVMVPPNVPQGTVERIESGSFPITQTVAVIKGEDGKSYDVAMRQVWPIRQPRPVSSKHVPQEPLISGPRVIDTFFPLVKGGTACVPGPFGSGKTVVQHQLAKWADADIIVFIGCGERGNEMTDVLVEFPELKDPKSGEPLMKRTILVANTSNMPVAAREASVYTGITIAEYYRDMGYNVALTADSTSRWAEALREMSGRLEEMPGEEGYPAYLGSRTAEFYERAGQVRCLGSADRMGSLTVIGAVSPPGGDLSEPVTQNTLRVAKVFWGLDAQLAYKRHFPAINWLTSYSLYSDDITEYMGEHAGSDWGDLRSTALKILQQEAALEEIVRLVGIDALSAKEQLVLQTAKTIREDFLHQNAFDDVDTYTSLKKQYWMLKAVITFHERGGNALENGTALADVVNHPLRRELSRAKEVPEDGLQALEALVARVQEEV